MNIDPTPVVHADRLHGSASHSARASATVLRLASSDAGPRGTALSGLRLATSTAEVNTDEHPRSSASSVEMTGPPGAPSTAVRRRAGDIDHDSGTVTRTTSGADLPFLKLGSSRLTSTANWGRPDRPFVLSSALVRPGETVLSSGDDSPLMQVGRGSQSRTQTQLVAVPGQSTLGMRTTARTELSAITLFQGSPTELTIRFLTAPSLTAIAAGNERTDVRYVPPVVAVTAAQGRSYRLDTAGDRVEVPLAGPGGGDGEQGVVRISLGAVRERVGHTSVDATVAALRLQILGAEGVGRLLDGTVGDLDVSAHVPVGGLPCRVRAQASDESAAGATRSGGSGVKPSPDAASPLGGRVSGGAVSGRPGSGRPESSGAVPAGSAPNEARSGAPQGAASRPVEPSPSRPVEPSPASPSAQPTLPLTGASLSLLAAIGLALLTIGWILLRAVRRPRR